MTGKTTIAIPTGDPAGIGPEISLKAALDPAVRAACNPMIVSDPGVVAAARRSLRHQQPKCASVARIADAELVGRRG